MQGEGWKKVISKRAGSRWDIFPFGGRNRGIKLSMVTSFFVSEFPDYANAKSLFELFGCSGKVVEVAISPRRTRFGKRFAFARFVEVDDGRVLAIRLDNTMFEGRKLHVNLPRFPRILTAEGGKPGVPLSKGVAKNTASFAVGRQGYRTGAFKGASFAEVVGRKAQGSGNSKKVEPWLTFHSNPELRSRFEKSYIGRVCIPGSAYNIQTYMEMEGVFNIKVIPLGGNCCLLEEREVGFIDELIKEGESWWKSWFLSIEKWEAGMVDGRRDVWIRVFGVPIHAWSSEFFVTLGERWGRFICIDEATAKGEAFDVARIMINMPIASVLPDCVSVCIDGSMFNFCIREDQQGSYRAGGGVRKLASSDDNSSEFDSERLALSESDFSMKSDRRDISVDIGKELQVDIPLENSSQKLRVAVSEDASRTVSKVCSEEELLESSKQVDDTSNSNDSIDTNTAIGADSICKGIEVVADSFGINAKHRCGKGKEPVISGEGKVLVSRMEHGCEDLSVFNHDSGGFASTVRICGSTHRSVGVKCGYSSSFKGVPAVNSAVMGCNSHECEEDGVVSGFAEQLVSPASHLNAEFMAATKEKFASTSRVIAEKSVTEGVEESCSAGSGKLLAVPIVGSPQQFSLGDDENACSYGTVPSTSGQAPVGSLKDRAAISVLGSSAVLGDIREGKN